MGLTEMAYEQKKSADEELIESYVCGNISWARDKFKHKRLEAKGRIHRLAKEILSPQELESFERNVVFK
jgi:hypothetical protein